MNRFERKRKQQIENLVNARMKDHLIPILTNLKEELLGENFDKEKTVKGIDLLLNYFKFGLEYAIDSYPEEVQQ